MGMIYQRGKVYWIKYYRNGKPFYESSKCHKESKAKRLLKKREGEISQGKLPGVYFDRVEFDNLASDFLADYMINQKNSLGKAETSVEHLTKYFGGFRVPQITTPRIHAYIEQRSAWECNQCDETFLAGEIEDRTESIYIAAQISSSGSPEREEEAFAIRFLEQGRNRQGEAF